MSSGLYFKRARHLGIGILCHALDHVLEQTVADTAFAQSNLSVHIYPLFCQMRQPIHPGWLNVFLFGIAAVNNERRKNFVSTIYLHTKYKFCPHYFFLGQDKGVLKVKDLEKKDKTSLALRCNL